MAVRALPGPDSGPRQSASTPGSQPSNSWLVYRLLDDDGRLLYVGMSSQWLNRLRAHAVGQTWANRIATVTLTRYATKTAALKAEQSAIESESPEFNSAGPNRERSALLVELFREHGPMSAATATARHEWMNGSLTPQLLRMVAAGTLVMTDGVPRIFGLPNQGLPRRLILPSAPMNEHARTVGARLRRARGRRSAEEMATRIGVTSETIYRWEVGSLPVSPKRYAGVAKAYGRRWDKLFAPEPVDDGQAVA